jgi:hypothetical protein
MKITFDGKEFAKKEFGLFVQVFEILAETEWDPLISFLESPYFNEDSRIAKLYQRILESRRLGSERINGRPLLKFVFGDLPESKGKALLRKFLKALPDLVITYIEHQEIRTNRRLGGRVKVLSLKRRFDSSFFDGAAAEMEQTLSDMPTTLMQFEEFWWLHHQQYFHQYTQQYHETGAAYLSKSIQDLQLFYQLTALRYYCEVLNREKILGKELIFASFKQKAGKFIDEDSSLPLINFYSKLARLLQFPDELRFYTSFKSYYGEFKGQLAQPDQLVLIKSVSNVWIRKYEKGYENGPKELLYWAREGLRAGVYLFESSLSDKEYLNIAIAAGLAAELSFMENFIEGYKEELEESIQDRAYHMARIYLHFYRNDLITVLEELGKYFPAHKSFDHIYTLRVKVVYLLTYLICYIEGVQIPTEDGEDKLLMQLEAYRKYVYRTDFLDETRRAPLKSFHDFCNKVYKYAAGNPDLQTKAKKANLLKAVKEEKLLVGRYVLIRIIEKLKAR